jgi:hypothetical protein
VIFGTPANNKKRVIQRTTFVIKGMHAQRGDFIQVNLDGMVENPDPGDPVDEDLAVNRDPADHVGGVDRGLLAAAVRRNRRQAGARRAFAALVVLGLDRDDVMVIQRPANTICARVNNLPRIMK